MSKHDLLASLKMFNIGKKMPNFSLVEFHIPDLKMG